MTDVKSDAPKVNPDLGVSLNLLAYSHHQVLLLTGQVQSMVNEEVSKAVAKKQAVQAMRDRASDRRQWIYLPVTATTSVLMAVLFPVFGIEWLLNFTVPVLLIPQLVMLAERTFRKHSTSPGDTPSQKGPTDVPPRS